MWRLSCHKDAAGMQCELNPDVSSAAASLLACVWNENWMNWGGMTTLEPSNGVPRGRLRRRLSVEPLLGVLGNHADEAGIKRYFHGCRR